MIGIPALIDCYGTILSRESTKIHHQHHYRIASTLATKEKGMRHGREPDATLIELLVDMDSIFDDQNARRPVEGALGSGKTSLEGNGQKVT